MEVDHIKDFVQQVILVVQFSGFYFTSSKSLKQLTWPMANLLNSWGFHIFSGENKPFKRLYFRVQDG